jgi:hypothetical protein
VRNGGRKEVEERKWTRCGTNRDGRNEEERREEKKSA